MKSKSIRGSRYIGGLTPIRVTRVVNTYDSYPIPVMIMRAVMTTPLQTNEITPATQIETILILFNSVIF